MEYKQRLPFISDEDLYKQVKHVLDIARDTSEKAESRLFENTVDPFSALFDAIFQGISLKQWLKQEKARQTQKTLQNALGDFHQEILGSIPGWKSLGKGNIFDLKNDKLKIIAEVKNKYNTTKGNHKVAIYDDLGGQLKSGYKGYTAYYVEIIPKNKIAYNKPFVPSDNRTHKRRPERKDIRVIDGKSFYHLATGDCEAIKKLYNALPGVIYDILGKKGSADNSYLHIDDFYSDVGIARDKSRGQEQGNVNKMDLGNEYAELFEKVY